MGLYACTQCDEHPVVRCGRCTTTLCKRHAFVPGNRCARCEADYTDDAPLRRNAKLLFAPSAAILSGGMIFGILFPVLVSTGIVGAIVIYTIATMAGSGAAIGACSLIERSARSVFLRERGGMLPEARLILR